MPSHKYDYDAIIIGAGISGLVCGCYLAKSGLKTLIVEKNAKPGGYCTSFTRNGFKFDACAHSLGSLREDGIIRKVLRELDVENRIKIIRHNPQDLITTPEHKINFWNEIYKTIHELKDSFPKENKNIENFLTYLNNSNGISSAELRKKTLKDLLDSYFDDDKLKSIFSILVLGNLGLPSSRISAFTAVKFYKEFIIDGGYYPDGGMHVFSDHLAKRFKELGGHLSFLSPAVKIKIRNSKTEGITILEHDFISSKYVISNCDAMQTFYNLIGGKISGDEITSNLRILRQSLSMFVLYLGIDDGLRGLPKKGVNVWILPSYDIEKMYAIAREGAINNSSWLMMRVMPDSKGIIAFVSSSFKDIVYWKDKKDELTDICIKKMEIIIPKLSKHIILKDAATPYTLYKWTLNYRGASYGWESLPSQFAIHGLSQITPIKNLYLTGHWTTLAQGIPGVVYLGRDTAKIIIGRKKK